MRRSSVRIGAWLAASMLAACDAGQPVEDAGPEPECAADSDCDDGSYCDGAERCEAGRCVAGSVACMPTQTCDEDADECLTACEVESDADGDGHSAQACGGDDCDDADANRFTGNTEVCDAAGHDEDCDPGTYGALDEDGDGYTSVECCNGSTCGDDCDDADPEAHPTQAEVCGDGADNDCDGAVDEGIDGVTWWRDGDGDGWGDGDGATMSSCARPAPEWADRSGDCDDRRREVHPGAREVVGDGRDNDCDGVADENYELRGGIESLGEVQALWPYRLSRQRIEAVSTTCAPGGRPCVTGGIVSGDSPWGGRP